MQIRLSDNYYLKSDENNYMICSYRGKDKRGNDVYENLSFHMDIVSALKSLMERKLRRSEVTTIEGLLDTINNLRIELDQLLTRVEI